MCPLPLQHCHHLAEGVAHAVSLQQLLGCCSLVPQRLCALQHLQMKAKVGGQVKPWGFFM